MTTTDNPIMPPDLTTDLPDLYLKYPPTSFPSEWREALDRFLREKRWSLYLFSKQNGTGKSCFACSVLAAYRRDLVRKGTPWPYYLPGNRGGLWMSMPRYVPIIRDLDRWPTFRRRACETPLLVVDDLAAGRNTPHVVEEMVLMLMRRYEASLRTIITSNLPLAELADTMDRRLASRLQDGVILQAGATDLRRRPKPQ